MGTEGGKAVITVVSSVDGQNPQPAETQSPDPIDRVGELLKAKDLNASSQYEFSRLVDLLQKLRKAPSAADDSKVVMQTIEALAADPRKLDYAFEIRRRIEQRYLPKWLGWLRWLNAIGSFRDVTRYISQLSPTVRVVFGLVVASLCLAILPALYVTPRLAEVPLFYGVDARLLLFVAIFGALGSIVSILVRLPDFAQAQAEGLDPWSLFFTGFFKPIIGVSFALFVAAALLSDMVPIKLPAEPTKLVYLLITLAFVSGFSERFARDVITRIEGQGTK